MEDFLLKTLIIGAAALALCAPAGAALAHDWDGGGFDNYRNHARGHEEHYGYHQEEAEEHREAHERGFYSPEDHWAGHHEAREAHRDFHEDHPDTWHDHYGYNGGGYGDSYGRHRYRGHRDGWSVQIYRGY